MASQKVDRHALGAAALEGFSSIEQRRPMKPTVGRAQNLNHQRNEAAAIINSKEAAQRYGGMVFEPVITSEKAAQRYGGVVIGPPITSDKAVERYGGMFIAERPKAKSSRST